MVTCLLLFGAAAAGEAQPAARQVLLLQALDRGDLTIDSFTRDFRAELDQRTGGSVNVVQITVVPSGLTGPPAQAVLDYIRAIYADRPTPDLIVTVTGPAAVFARTYRHQLFPDTPLLFAALDQRFLQATPLSDNQTAVPSLNDYPRFVDTILQLLPQTQQVFMVMGSGAFRDFWRPELEKQFQRFKGRVTFVWLDGLSLPEILRRSAQLPDRSAIFFVSFLTDAQGASYADERVIADLRATAHAPLFGVQSVYMGTGMVGGPLTPIDALSRKTAEVAIQLLDGASPGSIRVPPQGPGELVFDWRELQRWGIPETRLPPGSIVRYRAPSLWSTYRGTVLTAAAVLAIQSLLIAGLLYQRRARQRAELDSRENLALAANASRRQTMAALTGSIAHDLGQPLSSIIHNAQALQMMVTANRAAPDTIEEILGDIQTQGVQATRIIDRHRTLLRSHQLDIKPIDLRTVIDDSLALVDHDMKARQIEAIVDLPPDPCVISGDRVLLQQVLVNLVVNAMDAMTETPRARRRLTIRTEIRAAEVDLSVSDTGPGLPAQIDGQLFTPFVTTKAQGIGIGLTIARSIVDAHRGTIAARNNPDGGATFTVTLRRSESPALVADALH